ncbi:MAG: glutamate-cysteine ligase family protein [Myxococcota bacterium]
MRPALDLAQPASSIADLVGYFRASCTPADRLRVGTEHEKIGLLEDTLTPLPYHGPRSVAAMLERLATEGGGRLVREGAAPIALEMGTHQITLEPGAQVELSGAPLATVHEFASELREHMAALREVSDPLGVTWIGLGYRPFGPRAAVPWVPKRRYDIMRPYLATRGRRAHDMMQMTATVQANLDFTDEEDCARKMRAAMSATSLVTALFASSPLEDGHDTGFLSWRAAAWHETDPDRCGILPFVWDADFGFRRYAEWALDVPMFFVRREGAYRPGLGTTFRRFMQEGFEGLRPTLEDWETHLSTLFPEMRLKNYVEVRGADAGPLELVTALPALCKGILYDREALDATERLMSDVPLGERLRLRAEVPRAALRTPLGRGTVGDRARELVAIAREGLRRQAALDGDGRDESRFLDPLEEIAAQGRCHAERVLEVWRRAPGDVRALMDTIRL